MDHGRRETYKNQYGKQSAIGHARKFLASAEAIRNHGASGNRKPRDWRTGRGRRGHPIVIGRQRKSIRWKNTANYIDINSDACFLFFFFLRTRSRSVSISIVSPLIPFIPFEWIIFNCRTNRERRRAERVHLCETITAATSCGFIRDCVFRLFLLRRVEKVASARDFFSTCAPPRKKRGCAYRNGRID